MSERDLLEDRLRDWSGEHAIIRFDRASGTWIFIAAHSTRLGPATGGTRMRPYPSPAEGLADAMRLAEAMTRKFALIGVPAGGGKAVLAVRRPLAGGEREALLERYGNLLASLCGAFETGPDLGTGPADMDVIGRRTAHVFGRSPAHGGAGNSGPATATGVYHAIRAACQRVFGEPSLGGRSVFVEGLGAVGQPLVERLVADGARVIASDVDEARMTEVRSRWPVELAPPGAAAGVDCDVYAPCAIGGVLSAASIPRLCCRIVAGAANNQLATADDARRLAERGILYAPDFAVNGGAAIYLQGVERLGWSPDEIDTKLAGIGQTLLVIFERAEKERINTCEAAEDLAVERLESALSR